MVLSTKRALFLSLSLFNSIFEAITSTLVTLLYLYIYQLRSWYLIGRKFPQEKKIQKNILLTTTSPLPDPLNKDKNRFVSSSHIPLVVRWRCRWWRLAVRYFDAPSHRRGGHGGMIDRAGRPDRCWVDQSGWAVTEVMWFWTGCRWPGSEWSGHRLLRDDGICDFPSLKCREDALNIKVRYGEKIANWTRNNVPRGTQWWMHDINTWTEHGFATMCAVGVKIGLWERVSKTCRLWLPTQLIFQLNLLKLSFNNDI